MVLGGKNINNINKKLLFFAIVLLVGILIYSGALFLLNIYIPAEQTPYFTINGIPILEIRLIIRRVVEITYSICEIIYSIGSIIVLWCSVKSETPIKLTELLQFSIGTIIALFLVNVPFILLDKDFAIDYLYPVLNVSGNILLIFSITGIVNIVKRRRAQTEKIE